MNIRKQLKFGLLTVFTVSSLVVYSTANSVAYALEISVSNNGSGAESEVVVQQETTTNVVQSNEANIQNNIEVNADTGNNNASSNAGDVAIETGDASESITVETEVNESVIDLECCETGETKLVIEGNGDSSGNSINIESINDTDIQIVQTAKVENKLGGKANTGNNTANSNNGKVSISTGDIYATSTVKNGPVNVVHVSGGIGSGGLSATISRNGADSKNTITFFDNPITNIFIANNAYIGNNVVWHLNTGGNIANRNNGDVGIATGDIYFESYIENGPINFSNVDWDSCCAMDDPDDPSDPGDPDDDPIDSDTGSWTYDDPDSPGGSSQGSGVGGALTSADIANILGLSDTSSEESKNFAFWLGLGMVICGMFLIGKTSFFQPSFEK